MVHRGRRRAHQASVESLYAPTYEENLVERLARSLERSGFTGVTVDQARRLGAMGFDGSMDPMGVLSWLDDTEKILDKGMQCPDEDVVRIAGFVLGGSARKWWAYERTRRRHTWAHCIERRNPSGSKENRSSCRMEATKKCYRSA